VSTFTFTGDAGSAPRATSVSKNGLVLAVTVNPNEPQRRVTQQTDPNGNITTYAYDSYHLISKTEAYGTAVARTTGYSYLNSGSALPTGISGPLQETDYSYYSGTNLINTKTLHNYTPPLISRQWVYTYDSSGRTLTVDGPRTDVSDVTTYSYYTCTDGYQCGAIATLTTPGTTAVPSGLVTTFNTYNAHQQTLTSTDPNGVVTTLTYDLRQRLTSRTVGTETTTFTYLPTGLIQRVALPDGSYVAYTYDAAHRLVTNQYISIFISVV
jgi:YD repeat-containing protein